MNKSLKKIITREGLILFTLLVIFFVVLYISCSFSYHSYWKTKSRVQDIDIGMLHKLLPSKVANVMNAGDISKLEEITEINNSLFGIMITDRYGKNILASNKPCKDMNAYLYLNRSINESYDRVILYNQDGSDNLIARIYYFKSPKPAYYSIFLKWLKHPFNTKYREWDFMFIIYTIIFLLVFAILKLTIQINSSKEKAIELEKQVILQDIQKLENEYNILEKEYREISEKYYKEKLNNEEVIKKEALIDNKFESLVKMNIEWISKDKDFKLYKKDKFTLKEGEMDHIVISFKNSLIFVIEDKAYNGKISGNVNSAWYCQYKDDRKVEIKSIGDNPYKQVRNYVMGTKRYLRENGFLKEPFIIGVMLFPDKSDFTGLDLKELPRGYCVKKVNELRELLKSKPNIARIGFNYSDIKKLKSNSLIRGLLFC